MSLRPGSSSQTRTKSHKSGIDSDQCRRRRKEQLATVRKNKRQGTIRKKRTQTHASTPHFNNKMLEAIPSMVQLLRSGNTAAQVIATLHFKTLSEFDDIDDPSVDAVVQAGVIPFLVKFLERFDAPQLQLKAAQTLSNIGYETSEHITAIVEHGAVPRLVNLLRSTTTNHDAKEQAALALGNICTDSTSYRDLILNLDVLSPLLYLLDPSSRLTTLKICSRTLSNLVRKDYPPVNFEQVSHSLPVLKLLLIKSTDEEVLSDACWALSYLSDDGSIEKIQAIAEPEICTKLVKLLECESINVIAPVLRTLANIASCDETHTQLLIDSGLLQRLHLLFKHKHKKFILEEVCWIISNITSRNSTQIQAVVESEIIPHVLSILNDAVEFNFKEEAAWAIINATCEGSLEQIRYLVAKGCIKPLCELLTCPDLNLVSACLDGLKNILVVGEVDKETGLHNDNVYAKRVDECEGWDDIEKLQNHDNSDICYRAERIVERFWAEDDMVED